jgi:hypothetical protein
MYLIKTDEYSAPGSTIFPMKSIELIDVSIIMYSNGLSIFIINLTVMEVRPISTIVAAAASVPASFVSMKACW